MEENKVVDTEQVKETEQVKATAIIEQSEGIGKKAVKWVLRGLALVATGVVGFFIGRSINGDDANDEPANETSSEE